MIWLRGTTLGSRKIAGRCEEWTESFEPSGGDRMMVWDKECYEGYFWIKMKGPKGMDLKLTSLRNGKQKWEDEHERYSEIMSSTSNAFRVCLAMSSCCRILFCTFVWVALEKIDWIIIAQHHYMFDGKLYHKSEETTYTPWFMIVICCSDFALVLAYFFTILFLLSPLPKSIFWMGTTNIAVERSPFTFFGLKKNAVPKNSKWDDDSSCFFGLNNFSQLNSGVSKLFP